MGLTVTFKELFLRETLEHTHTHTHRALSPTLNVSNSSPQGSESLVEEAANPNPNLEYKSQTAWKTTRPSKSTGSAHMHSQRLRQHAPGGLAWVFPRWSLRAERRSRFKLLFLTQQLSPAVSKIDSQRKFGFL